MPTQMIPIYTLDAYLLLSGGLLPVEIIKEHTPTNE